MWPSLTQRVAIFLHRTSVLCEFVHLRHNTQTPRAGVHIIYPYFLSNNVTLRSYMAFFKKLFYNFLSPFHRPPSPRNFFSSCTLMHMTSNSGSSKNLPGVTVLFLHLPTLHHPCQWSSVTSKSSLS